MTSTPPSTPPSRSLSVTDVVSAGWQSLKGEAKKDANAVKSAVHEAELKGREAKKHWIESHDGFRIPYAHDIGGEYDATFAQPSVTQRVVITTPDLVRCRSGALSLTSLHEHTQGSASQEQLTMNARYGATKTGILGMSWKRPIRLDATAYGCLPMQLATIKPTVKFTIEATDATSGVGVGFTTRLSGPEFIHTLQTRSRFGTLTAALQNHAKMPQFRTVTGSVATTWWRDAVKDRSINAGVQVQSGTYNSAETSFPSKVNGVTFRAEYDERQWTFDTTIKANQYAQPGTSKQSVKISDATIRGIYAHNLGSYPRWCAGASVGLVDSGETNTTTPMSTGEPSFEPYNEPDPTSTSIVGQLTSPVASTSLSYQLNPNNKLKLTVDSTRRLRSTYQYSLTSNVLFVATFQALFPSFDVKSLGSISSATAGIKPTLGLAVHINAE